MTPRSPLNLAVSVTFAASAALFAACGPSPITANRIEAALQAEFVNLVELQVSRLGLRPLAAADIVATTYCRRASGGDSGAGEWSCALVWQAPDRRSVRETYDVSVTTDGCYSASVSGDTLGGPMLKGADGRDVRNLLYVFEGCFETM